MYVKPERLTSWKFAATYMLMYLYSACCSNFSLKTRNLSQSTHCFNHHHQTEVHVHLYQSFLHQFTRIIIFTTYCAEWANELYVLLIVSWGGHWSTCTLSEPQGVGVLYLILPWTRHRVWEVCNVLNTNTHAPSYERQCLRIHTGIHVYVHFPSTSKP